jgi:2-oxoisovalerate dehydrogenase E1 component
VDFEPVRIVDSIREGLAERMEADDRVMLLGEDICDPYGGAFKVTRGLSTRFPDRVFNTPISEAAIVGMANGLALAGFRPVAEIMFGDFLLLAADQIVNHAAKFSDMYNGQVRMPLVIRTPMGGYRGYGPTHSQSLEKHLFGIPGTRMLALNHRWPPCELYRRCFALDDGPVIIIENKLLYGRQAQAAGFEGFKTTATADAFPTMRIRPTKADPDLTLVCYGGMLELAEQAAATLLKTEEIAVEILAPTQVYPLDLCPLMESIQQTRRLLVVEEGQGFSGFGSEVIASATERLQGISLQCARVCAVPSIIPAGKPSESKSLPSVEDITSSALQLILQ